MTVSQRAPHALLGQPAGFVTRCCAFLVDLLLINGTLIAVTAVTGLLLRYYNYDNLLLGWLRPP